MDGFIVLATAFSLFLLQRRSFESFRFPRWQSVLAFTLIGVLTGLDPNMRAGIPGMSPLQAILMAVLMIWTAIPVVVGVNKWWLKRGGRWDGQGDLLNLLAASWLVADTLGAGLTALGVAPLLTLPLWLYSIWVSANTLSGAIPKASRGYAISGIVLSIIPAFLISFIVMAVTGVAMTIVTGVPPVAR